MNLNIELKGSSKYHALFLKTDDRVICEWHFTEESKAITAYLTVFTVIEALDNWKDKLECSN